MNRAFLLALALLPLAAGAQTHSGTLASGDPRLPSGEFADSYTVQAQAGQTITADMTSSAFDTYVMIVSPSGALLAENDDYQGSTGRSYVQATAAQAGAYRVQATSYNAGETGAYRVIVSTSGGSGPVAQAPRPAVTPEYTAIVTRDGFCFTHGDRVITWTCGTDSNRFRYYYHADRNAFTIRTQDNRCLDGYRGKGQPLAVVACDGTQEQDWWMHTSGQLQNQRRFGGRNLCIDVSGGNGHNRSVVLWDCGSQTNQQFGAARVTSNATGPLTPRSLSIIGRTFNSAIDGQVNAGGLIGNDSGGLIGNDGASIVAAGGGHLIAAGGGNLIQDGAGY